MSRLARLSRRQRLALQVLQGVVVLGVASWVLVPQAEDARHSLSTIGVAQLVWLAAAMVAVLLSFLAFSLVTAAMLRTEGYPMDLRTVIRMDLSTIAVSHAVPAGAAVGTALGTRLLTSRGVPILSAGFVKVSQGALSQVLLQLMLWFALALAIPVHGTSPLYVTATIVGGATLLIVGFAVWLLIAKPGLPAAMLDRFGRRLPPKVLQSAQRGLKAVPAHLRALGADRGRLAWICGWSMGNWIFDAAALWLCVRAFGFSLGYVELIVAFGLAAVLAAIPITPSGLGVVEGVLVPTLVAFGCPTPAAVLGVLGWRVVNFWLPIPLGGAAYLALRAEGRNRRDRWAEAPAELPVEPRVVDLLDRVDVMEPLCGLPVSD
jgi:uncharacterized protein (TIRG00374 family)